MGLPLRPGIPTCSYYAQHCICKFGTACKFDDPMGTLSYSPSASSLSDMPVALYPVGTLAPSSSSSDLRAEVTSGSNNESASTTTTTLSTSVTVSTTSAGFVLSKSGSISQSGLQQSSHNSPTSSSSGKGGATDGGAPN